MTARLRVTITVTNLSNGAVIAHERVDPGDMRSIDIFIGGSNDAIVGGAFGGIAGGVVGPIAGGIFGGPSRGECRCCRSCSCRCCSHGSRNTNDLVSTQSGDLTGPGGNTA